MSEAENSPLAKPVVAPDAGLNFADRDAEQQGRQKQVDTEDINSVEGWLAYMDGDTVSILPYSFAKRHKVMTLFDDALGVHLLCIERPPFEVYAELKRRIKTPILFHEVAELDFDSALRQAYEKGQSAATQMVDDIGDEIDLSLLTSEIHTATDLLEVADDAPVVRLINTLLTQAIRENASDIHLEVFEKRSLVRFRSDGVLKDIVEPRRELHGALVSRLKVMASLDIAEKRLPQDGRISLNIGDRPVDVRVSCLPTQYGERVVLRILDKRGTRLNLRNLVIHAQISKIQTRTALIQ